MPAAIALVRRKSRLEISTCPFLSLDPIGRWFDRDLQWLEAGRNLTNPDSTGADLTGTPLPSPSIANATCPAYQFGLTV
jgi:hypothetical protein